LPLHRRQPPPTHLCSIHHPHLHRPRTSCPPPPHLHIISITMSGKVLVAFVVLFACLQAATAQKLIPTPQPLVAWSSYVLLPCGTHPVRPVSPYACRSPPSFTCTHTRTLFVVWLALLVLSNELYHSPRSHSRYIKSINTTTFNYAHASD
jgi:hypothetical protein